MFNPLSALAAGLKKTREALAAPLARLITGRRRLDDELREEIEARLLAADLGPLLANDYLDALEKEYRGTELDAAALGAFLQARMRATLAGLPPAPSESAPDGLTVWLLAGVNGAGKTTTAGKLARRLGEAGQGGVIAAADTFRAAAVDQLKVWGERAGWPVISGAPGADPAAVAFDGLRAAQARGARRLLVDTAGRLQTKQGLMDELGKIRRVLAKGDAPPPVSVFLVLDATVGQNGLAQAREFLKAGGLDALILTKLDGTAKGGALLAIAHELKLPIAYVGVGEKAEDLLPFNADDFVAGLWGDA